MSLKSMHEAKKNNEGPSSSSSTELLRQQRERITELEGLNTSLQQQLSEAKMIGSENLASATAAAEKKITELQSELQKRKQNEQQQSEEIVRLLNRLESLSNSDLQLKEAEQKLAAAKAQNEESQRILTTARNSNAAADRKVAAARAETSKAEAAQRAADRLADERSQEIEARAKEKAKSNEYYYRGWLAAAMAYGILVTIFTAIGSKAFTSDFLAFWEAVWVGITWTWDKLLLGASWAAGVANYIPQEIAATILYWVILVILMGVALVIVGVGLIAAVGKVFEFYQYAGDPYDKGDSFADNVTFAELLVSLAALVFFADPIRDKLPINLLLLFILCHVAFIGLRWMLKKRKDRY